MNLIHVNLRNFVSYASQLRYCTFKSYMGHDHISLSDSSTGWFKEVDLGDLFKL